MQIQLYTLVLTSLEDRDMGVLFMGQGTDFPSALRALNADIAREADDLNKESPDEDPIEPDVLALDPGCAGQIHDTLAGMALVNEVRPDRGYLSMNDRNPLTLINPPTVDIDGTAKLILMQALLQDRDRQITLDYAIDYLIGLECEDENLDEEEATAVRERIHALCRARRWGGPRSDTRQEPKRGLCITHSHYAIDLERKCWQWAGWSGEEVGLVVEVTWGEAPDPLDRKKQYRCEFADDALWQLRDIVAFHVRSDVRTAV
jgi:hypothetical protein